MIQDVDLTKRIVTGFFSTFSVVDQVGDILLPGCAAASIAARGPNSSATGKIKHLLHHDPTQLPGRIIRLEEGRVNGYQGIYFETKMSQTALGEETLIKYQEGIYDNHSIGYNYIPTKTAMATPGTKLWEHILKLVRNPEAMIQREEVFVVTEIDLFEGSTVFLGTNFETPYLGVKAKTSQEAMYEYIAKNFKL